MGGQGFRKTLPGKALLGFSPTMNLAKILAVSSKGDQTLRVLNGVRVFSICYVIYGHVLSFGMMKPTLNIFTA